MFDYIGMTFRYRSFGRITSPVTPSNTLTLDVRLGSVIVATSQAITLNATAQTNQTWSLEWYLTLRAVDSAGGGATANFMHSGLFVSRAIVGSGAAGNSCGILNIPETAPAVGTSFDMTASQAFNSFATWSGAASTYSITCHMFVLELVN